MRDEKLTMSRRTLVLVAPAVALASRSGIHAGCQTNAWKIDPANLESFFGALASIRQIGFEGFETGFRNLESQFAGPDAARKRIEDSGLRFFGIHIFLTSYDQQTSIAPWDLAKRVADGGAALGAERLILSGAPTPDAASLKRKAAALNRIGKYCRGKKLKLGYHNHDAEFRENTRQISGILRETDEEWLHLIVDAGHALEAGADVAGFFARNSKRIDGLHMRDAKAGKEVPLGQGDYNWAPLASAVRAANWTGWVLCEEERLSGEKPGDSAVRPAREAVRRIFGA